MEISDRVDLYLWQLEDINRLKEFLRPNEWHPGVVGPPRQVQFAKQAAKILRSLVKSRERGWMTEDQAIRCEDLLRQLFASGPLAEGISVPALLMAHLERAKGALPNDAVVVSCDEVSGSTDQISESKWCLYEDPTPMLVFLRDKVSERKLRLFAVACCRRIWNLIPDKPGHKAVEQAERYADGVASRQQLARARWACSPRAHLSRPPSERDHNWLAMLAVLACVSNDVGNVEAVAMASAMAHADSLLVDAPATPTTYSQRQKHRAQEHSYQASLLREVVGNPFRSVTFGPAGLTPAIEALADAIYGERAFDRMPVLGDALEEAGLNSIEVLGHCREPGEHVRGCWVLDALLGKA
jgi:hypothetical protein